MEKLKKYLKNNWRYILIFIVALSISWPLFRTGYFSHQDDLQVIRIFEMRKCLVDGQIPCRWVPDMGWGNGYPLFNFYGVSPYYLGAFLSFVFGYIFSAKILFFLALTLGGLGIYLLVEKIWGRNAALVSSILYLIAPYKALDIYVRGALSESMALGLIPFVFYFFYELIKNPKNKKYFLFSSTFLFLFLITHNIMTVIFVPVLCLWIIYWLVTEKGKDIWRPVLWSAALGLGMSSFFLLPAFFEKSLVQTESLTRFELDFRANFVSLKQLFLDRAWGYGTSIPGPEGGMSFQIGWPYWLLAFVSVVLVFVKKVKKQAKILVLGIFLTFLLSIFMTHVKSSFIWERVPLLPYFQFPWRFLSLGIFTASILGGVVVTLFKEKVQTTLVLVIILITFALNWSYFKPREFYSLNDNQKLSGDLWDEQTRGAILDYLPKTALEPRERASDTPYLISGSAEIIDFQNKTNKWSFKALVDEKSEIELPVYYFPNWEVFVNGEKYPSNHDNILGRISVTLDQGEYQVEGKLKNTPVRNIGNIITLVSFIALIGYVKSKKN